MKPEATIFGGSAPEEGSDAYRDAEELGFFLTEQGYRVRTGGYYGTMEASARGALRAGTKAIGFPFASFDPKQPNKYVEPRKLRTLFERLESLIAGSKLVVSLPGSLGTLSELTTVWMMLEANILNPRPVVCCIGEKWTALMNALEGTTYVTEKEISLLHFFTNVAEFRDRFREVASQIQDDL